MKVTLKVEVDDAFLRSLRARWGKSGQATIKELTDWLTETMERDFERIADIGGKQGVVGEGEEVTWSIDAR